VRSYDLVLNSFVVELDAVLGIVAAEHEKILNGELLCPTPSNLQSRVLITVLAFL